ncbi:MAG TPA: DUF488 family protein [bacterium]|nr:DUF488 family protein [bacterium]
MKDRFFTERVYGPLSRRGGTHFLVDRLWPRGIPKRKLRLTAWLKDAAPSPVLRRWFGHDPRKWALFQRRYRKELSAHPEALRPLREAAHWGIVTLLYAAKDPVHNHARVLKEFLMSGGRSPKRGR